MTPVETYSLETLTSKAIHLTPYPLKSTCGTPTRSAGKWRGFTATCGRIETQDGTRLAYVLDMVRKAYESSVLQERLEIVERTLEHRRK